MADRKHIAQLVDELEHPDVTIRRKYMKKLIDIGSEAVPTLTNNLRLVEPDVRTSLVRVLGDIGDDRALLPLMRYVFDTQGEPAESDARGLAMQSIMNIAEPKHVDKLFEFLIDMKEDDDPFVRGYVLEAFGRLGDDRADPFIEEALEEETDEFVRECAERASKMLEESEGLASGRSQLSDRDLLRKIRVSSGAELEYYVEDLLQRDDAFELAVRLVREEDRDTVRGLRILKRLDDPRAREVARRQFSMTTSESAKAVCLRLLADHLEGDASEEELSVIRKGLHDSDPFISLAALEAAGVSGDGSLIYKTIEAVDSSDASRGLTAAQSLSRGLRSENRRHLPELVDVFHAIHRRRLGASPQELDEENLVRIEAYLVRAIDGVVDGRGMGTSEAREAALTALEQAGSHRPILVTALTLLDGLLPDEGLDEEERWSGVDVQPLLDLFEHSSDDVVERVLSIAHRALASDVPGVGEQLERLIYGEADQLLERVIPLLERTGGGKARGLLDELTNHTDDEVAEAASSALRRLHGSEDVIDVDYEAKDGD